MPNSCFFVLSISNNLICLIICVRLISFFSIINYWTFFLAKTNMFVSVIFGLCERRRYWNFTNKRNWYTSFHSTRTFWQWNRNKLHKQSKTFNSFGIIPPGVLPKLPEKNSKWVRELIISCLSKSPENRPTFADVFWKYKGQQLWPFQWQQRPKIDKHATKHEK